MVILINAHLFLIKFKYNINKNKHVMELSLTRFACLPIRWIDHHISYLSNPFPFTINTHILSQPIQIIISFLIIGMIYAFHMRTHSHRTHTINRICTRTTINMIHRTYISIQNMRPIIRIRRPTPILPPNKCKNYIHIMPILGAGCYCLRRCVCVFLLLWMLALLQEKQSESIHPQCSFRVI